MQKFAILYVDDEESNLRIFKDTFRRKFNIYTASSAKEGIELLEKHKVDLILSDQRMPEMSGVEFLKYTFKKFPRTNRILVTGYSDFDAVENAINQARVFQYVQKPWDEESLLEIIDDALKIYRLELENNKQKEELIIAKKKAEESDLLKTEFINNISHEVRTPLNGILGFANLLNKPEVILEDKKGYLSIIQRCSIQLVQIFDDILEYSQLVTKQVTPNCQQICVNNILLELCEIFAEKATKKGLELKYITELSNEQTTILTDPLQLNNILFRIADNAFRFTETGSVIFSSELKDDRLVICIKDTGVGIHPENQKEIFNRFSQENKEIAYKTGGLGLGLSIASEKAKLINADIWLESEKGKGAKFFVSIPHKVIAPESDNKQTKKESTNKLRSLKEAKIIVAEDEDVNFFYLKSLLTLILGKETVIIHAINGKEAVDLFISNPDTDIIFMDIKMPIMDGYEATSAIKEISGNVHIIAQTAYSSEDDKNRAYKAGCDAFLSKPFRKDELESILTNSIFQLD